MSRYFGGFFDFPKEIIRNTKQAVSKNSVRNKFSKDAFELANRDNKKDGGKMKSKSSKYHITKEGKKAKKGLWYNIAMKRKRGEKMRAKGAKGAPTEAAIKKSQGKA